MNDEQEIKLPFDRDDFLLNVFSAGKLCYLKGLGIFTLVQTLDRTVPPNEKAGISSPVIVPGQPEVVFVWVPSDEYFENVLEIDPALELAEFDISQQIKEYKPNTGLTIFNDKKGRRVFHFNYRIEASGEATCKLLGIIREYHDMLLREAKPICRIIKEPKKVIFAKL